MARHLQRDLDALAKSLLTMGGMVEQSTKKAIAAVMKHDKALAREVMEGDEHINQMENQVEEFALKTLALHQPVADDLRFIVTAMKVNNDLERMGDLAANMSERAIMLADLDTVTVPYDFDLMVEHVEGMVRDSLNALVERDSQLARKVCQVDDIVDNINRSMYEGMQTIMREEPAKIPQAVNMLSVSRHFERMADLATNIAEDVIFMVEGEIVRHNL